MTGEVNVVHVIDAEGPMYESLGELFKRVKEEFGFDIPPTKDNLKRIQSGEIGSEAMRAAFAPERVEMLGSWDSIDSILAEVNRKEYRSKYKDEFGGDWTLNWFCTDHIGYLTNPRKRDIGYHNIFDHYSSMEIEELGDTIEWHFHSMSTYREAHRGGGNCLRAGEIYQVLCRRIIDRGFFPRCFHSGFQSVGPDLHWFLEQFIPFDLSSFAVSDYAEFAKHVYYKNGRSGNWRGAPSEWSLYRPHHDNYRSPGNCNRIIGRCLKIGGNLGAIDEREVNVAFARAARGCDVLLSFFGHDWRDIRRDIDFVYRLLQNAKRIHPAVKWRSATAVEGFKNCLGYGDGVSRLRLSLELIIEKGDVPYIKILTVEGLVFGPQPFFAIKTLSGTYIYDNLDFGERDGIWYYAFHADTIFLSQVDTVAVAANDKYGNQSIQVLKPKDRLQSS